MRKGMGLIDRTGLRFGRLVVLRKDECLKPTKWVCLCDCGTTTVVRAGHLHSSHTISCGCVHRATIKAIQTIHGKHDSRAYSSWQNMKNRCLSPTCPAYPEYGGRGITICPEWIDSFSNFLADMGDRPKGTTIERKNNNLGYFKGNCIWAVPIVQANNTRRNAYVIIGGRRLTIAQWARVAGRNSGTIWHRLKRGVDPEVAVFGGGRV